MQRFLSHLPVGWQQAIRCCSTITNPITGSKKYERKSVEGDLNLIHRFLSFDGCNKSHAKSSSTGDTSNALSVLSRYKHLTTYYKRSNSRKKDGYDEFRKRLLDDLSLWLTGVLGIYGGVLSHRYFNRDEEDKCPLKIIQSKSAILLNPVLSNHVLAVKSKKVLEPALSHESPHKSSDDRARILQENFDKAAETFEQVSNECYGCLLNQYAIEYRKKNQCKKAFELFQGAAKYGHVPSIYNLGLCYEYGHGVEISLLKAAEYYKEAADMGHVKSMFNIATFHYQDEGVLPNENKELGFTYMKAAADQGLSQAQSFVALAYSQDCNWSEAFKYFKMAADQKDRTSLYNLAVCYEKGIGVTKDVNQAMSYYHLSAEMGDVLSQFYLGDSYQNGLRGVIKDLKESIKWFSQAMENGHQEAQNRKDLLEDEIAKEEAENKLDKTFLYSILKLPQSLLKPKCGGDYVLPAATRNKQNDWTDMDRIVASAL